MGRLDRRVRINGQDIEPGHLEAQLLALPGVARAMVVTHATRDGDMQLDAYVVRAPAAELDPQLLRSTLAAILPANELPRHVIVLDALPLLADGKLDLAALPLPAESVENTAAMAERPGTPTEQLLASVWRELLGVTAVRTSDNFFDIGGHSLMAVDMAARVQRETGVQLNLLDIANSTLATLAAELAVHPVRDARPAKRGFGLRKLFGLR